MKIRLCKSKARGMTLFEVLVVLAVIAVLVAILLPNLARSHTRDPRISCVNNLKQVGLAFRIWSGDNGDKYPMQVSVTNGGTMELIGSGSVFPHFQVMSNELSTPRILVCPVDIKRTAATNFVSGFNNSAISYFVGVDANETQPSMLLGGDRNITLSGVELTAGLHSLTTNSPIGWSKAIHKSTGNVLLADASVQQLTEAGLRKVLEDTGVATNRLAIP